MSRHGATRARCLLKEAEVFACREMFRSACAPRSRDGAYESCDIAISFTSAAPVCRYDFMLVDAMIWRSRAMIYAHAVQRSSAESASEYPCLWCSWCRAMRDACAPWECATRRTRNAAYGVRMRMAAKDDPQAALIMLDARESWCVWALHACDFELSIIRWQLRAQPVAVLRRRQRCSTCCGSERGTRYARFEDR